MKTHSTKQLLAAALAGERREGRSVGFVPTMGALHEGHLSLLRRARADNDVVVASAFVNPLQFAPTDDFARYPRDLDADAALAAEAGADHLFAPDVTEMYPRGSIATRVDVGPIGEVDCFDHVLGGDRVDDAVDLGRVDGGHRCRRTQLDHRKGYEKRGDTGWRRHGSRAGPGLIMVQMFVSVLGVSFRGQRKACVRDLRGQMVPDAEVELGWINAAASECCR